MKGPTILRRLTDRPWSVSMLVAVGEYNTPGGVPRHQPQLAPVHCWKSLELAEKIGAVTFKLGTGFDRGVVVVGVAVVVGGGGFV